MRVAAIDIGTNTVLLLVAERRRDGALVAVEERATITRLGEGVDRARALLPAAVARTNACLTEYAGAIAQAGATKIAVVGTSAMRDAAGGEAVRDHVARVLGVPARVISGDEEARLTFAGAVSGLALGGEAGGAPVAVFDIGGGSTEVVTGTLDASGVARAIDYAESFDVGSVRLTERHVRLDPPSAEELRAVAADAAGAFAAIPASVARAGRAGQAAGSFVPVGIAGTMTTLAAVSLAMQPYDAARVHGHVMRLTELRDVVARLAAMPLADRRNVRGLEPKRADVIVAGGLVAIALAERLEATEIRISDRGVRWGLAAMLLADVGADVPAPI